MRIVNFDLAILDQGRGLHSMYRHIEKCVGVCYKSKDDKLTEHTEALEHGTIYLTVPVWKFWVWKKYVRDPYTKVRFNRFSMYITTNYRVVVTNNWKDDITRYLTVENIPTEFHERRITVEFTISRAVANEFVQHRVFSFTQEPIEHCNCFNNELVFVKPVWFDNDRVGHDSNGVPVSWLSSAVDRNQEYARACYECEQHYKRLVKSGCSPQQATGVLLLDLKTELIMTGFESQWKDFFKFRCNSHAQAEVREVASILREWLKVRRLNVI